MKDSSLPRGVPTYKIGLNLLYKSGNELPEQVVYEEASGDGMYQFIRHKDGSRITVTSSHIRLHDQADLTNIPKTPLEYCREVGKGITQEEAQRLACPKVLSTLQQELLSWHYRLYHLLIWPSSPTSMEDEGEAKWLHSRQG